MDDKKTYIEPIINISYNFLYPLVGFIMNTVRKPDRTYLYWKDENIEDYKLIVHYKTDCDAAFRSFEKGEILNGKDVKDRLVNCYTVDDGMMYVFDLVDYAGDIASFMEGKYSKFSKRAKDKIMKYFGIVDDKIPDPGRTIYMALYPEIFFDKVAEELGYANSRYLRRIGELCRKYDVEEGTAYHKIVENCNCVPSKQVVLDFN